MSPLPCSPVSNSATSGSQSLPATSGEESDASLTTPRPGPANPAQRTDENLSRSSIPLATSPESVVHVQDGAVAVLQESGSSSAVPSAISSTAVLPERQRSVTFLHRLSSPDRRSIYTTRSPMSGLIPAASPGGEARVSREEEESSADENTAIFRREHAAATRQYGAVLPDDLADVQIGSSSTTSTRKRTSSKGKDVQRERSHDEDAKDDATEGWWKKILVKYGSVELENKGSVARDHLALERTFLAWLRTSLSFASIGIAVTQLFRLNTSLSGPDGSSDPVANLRSVGKPLGATFLGISILILLLGFHRYFESQHYVIRGKFPASRGSIVLVAFVAGGLIIASLAVVLAIAPTAYET